VGDGPNDASAMRIVGHAVAMGNAEPEAMDVSRHTVGHVDDAGLAEAIDLAVAA
jgi:hydroxymethylpyrimidine pyrophosphatase-like HAD family hydrolase